MSEDGKLCELCLLEESIVKKYSECQKLDEVELSIEGIMRDQSDRKVEKWLRKIKKNKENVQNRKRGNRVIQYIQYQIVEYYNI